MNDVRVAVVGCGYWGPNVVRTFAELPGTSVVAVADRQAELLEPLRRRYPSVRHFVLDHTDLLDLEIDAVAVCTPPDTHFPIVRTFLDHGIDVFVEKPLATSSSHAVQLLEIAELHERVLMVGHIGVYTPAVRAMKNIIGANGIGEIAYVDAVRGGLGMFRPASNVVWDLAPHDVSILMYLLDEHPSSVSARGIACVECSIEDVAYVTFEFPSGVLGHTRMSWLDPCKTRRITVVGRQQMVVFDDLETHEKLKIYDKRVDAIRRTDTFGDYQFAYHYGSVVSPFIEHDEPLRVECQHFVDCVRTRATPLTDGRNGLDVVRIVEAAQASMAAGGADVALSYDFVPEIPRSAKKVALAWS